MCIDWDDQAEEATVRHKHEALQALGSPPETPGWMNVGLTVLDASYAVLDAATGMFDSERWSEEQRREWLDRWEE